MYRFRFDDGLERLQAHMLEFKSNAPKRAVLPNDSENFDWGVWSIIEPIFKHSRSESNRVYDMVANLIKASAMVNFHSRDTVSWNVRTKDGLEEAEGVVATAQDIANVVRCLDVLRATTHEIDQRKRAVVDAINVKSEDGVVEGLDPIISYLEESDASQVNLPELENIIDDLEANYLISVDGDQYTANNWDALGEPRIDEHARFFTDCEDPMTGDPFLDWWDSRRDENETRGSDLFSDSELESTGTSVGSDADISDSTVDFDVDTEPWVSDVLGQIQTALDGVRVPDMSQLTVEGFIGLTGPDSSELTSVSTSGSMLDPDHAVWDVDDKADSWVTTETDARRHIQQAIR